MQPGDTDSLLAPIPPLHRYDPGPLCNVQSAVLAPDGSALYMQIDEATLDPTDVAAVYWPYVLGPLGVVLLLWAGWHISRVLRRPQRAGVPYCRRCNYDLSAHPAPEAPCPECGTPPARRQPVRGRTRRRRLALPVGATAVVLAGSVAMLAMVPLRPARPPHGWRLWPSHTLALLADKRGWAEFSALAEARSRIVAFDPATGEITRTVRVAARTFCPLTISPDGETLFVLDGDKLAEEQNDLLRIDGRTGRIIARATFSGELGEPSDVPPVAAFSPDGQTAYVQSTDRIESRSFLHAWDLAGGRVTEIVCTPVFEHWGRSFAVAFPEGEPPLIVSAPHFMEAHRAGVFEMRIHDPRDGSVETLIPSDRVASSAEVEITPDGRSLFLVSEYLERVLRLDPRGGGEAESLTLPDGDMVWFMLTQERGSGLLVLGSMGGGVYVYDLREEAWRAWLEVPPDLIAPQTTLSSNGRRVAAVCQQDTSGAAPGVFTSSLLIWSVPPAQDSPPAP